MARSARSNGEKAMAVDIKKLNRPWLVAVWPGMGHVAISAGYFLVAKLGMHILAEFSAQEVFDVEHVEVKGGLIRMGRLPRSRFFVWTDPRERHDLVVFIGEAQPSKGRHAFCQRLIEFARQLGIERVYTFAAMATPMHPEHASRVFAAATDPESLAELRRLELEVLEDGQIGGLNGVLLGVAAEGDLRGACLLGEMPHIFHQLPFPKASLAVLEAFTTIAGIHIDLTELSEQAKEVEQKLGELLEKVQEALEQQQEPDGPAEEDGPEFEPAAADEGSSAENREFIEKLFRQAHQNRAKAYELKRELDRLGMFREYEDRFLDLFKKPG
jgi:proteasome assembly chaperone (PAC2) family protein